MPGLNEASAETNRLKSVAVQNPYENRLGQLRWRIAATVAVFVTESMTPKPAPLPLFGGGGTATDQTQQRCSHSVVISPRLKNLIYVAKQLYFEPWTRSNRSLEGTQ